MTNGEAMNFLQSIAALAVEAQWAVEHRNDSEVCECIEKIARELERLRSLARWKNARSPSRSDPFGEKS